MTAPLEKSAVVFRTPFEEPDPLEISSLSWSSTASQPSTPATSPLESPRGTSKCSKSTLLPLTALPTPITRRPSPECFQLNLIPQANSLPKSKAGRKRREECEWQPIQPTSAAAQQPWYTIARAQIQPLQLHIPRSNYTSQHREYLQQQGKDKKAGALCLMANASPYPRP